MYRGQGGHGQGVRQGDGQWLKALFLQDLFLWLVSRIFRRARSGESPGRIYGSKTSRPFPFRIKVFGHQVAHQRVLFH